MTDSGPPESRPSPPPAAVPTSVGESRREQTAHRMHGARLYTGAFAVVGLIVVLIVLVSVNTRDVKLSWAFGSTHASLVWIIVVTAVIGWLLGLATAGAFHRRTRRRV